MKTFFSAPVAFLLLACLSIPVGASANTVDSTDSTQHTFAPIYEYRSSAAVDYSSLHIAGPIIKYESKADEHDVALRPLFYRSVASGRDASLTDVLYPLFRYKRDQNVRSFSLLRLINYDSGRDSINNDKEFSLFPFVFYRKRADQPTTAALFPLWGQIYHRFGRDEITYALWPLYIKTKRRHTEVRNYLWPFFATISGDDPQEKGFKLWPLFGKAEYPGVYRKFFLLWPFWFDYDERLNTDRPVAKRYFFPFYLYRESPDQSRRTVLWPFFTYLDDRAKGYKEWNFPWPFWQRATGEYKHGWKFLPFASDMTRNDIRTRWFLWPLLKHENHFYDDLTRRKTKLFFFVYRDLKETWRDSGRERYRRVLFWPLFGYEKRKGVAHFYSLALLKPLAPDSDGIERSWSPLWRIYQRKWDEQGNSVTSFLWNLYWSETRENASAWELFPLFSSRKEPGLRRWSLLKGLIGYERDAIGSRLKLLYIPWGIPLGPQKEPVKH